MTLLARLQTRLERRRGVLAAPEQLVDELGDLAPLRDTAGTPRLVRPEPTPSMHAHDFGPTAGTPIYRTPGGTPSTQRIHNPRHPGR